jgi:hypothetical protein
MRRGSIVLVLALLLLTGACSKKKKEPPPSCTDIVEKMMGFIKGEVGGEMGDRKGLVEQCEKTFSDDMKRCLGEAKDLPAVAECRGGKGKPRSPRAPDEKPKAPPKDPHEGMNIKP